MIQGSKDAALAFATRRVLNARLSPFGTITALSLDTAQRRAQFRLELCGEKEPLDVDVRKYDIERSAKGDWLTVVDAVASREWVTAALHHFAVGRRFHLSRKASMVLRFVT